MKVSTKNRLAGAFRTFKGTVKIAVGRALNNPRVAIAGHVDKRAGMIQANFGKFERILGK